MGNYMSVSSLMTGISYMFSDLPDYTEEEVEQDVLADNIDDVPDLKECNRNTENMFSSWAHYHSHKQQANSRILECIRNPIIQNKVLRSDLMIYGCVSGEDCDDVIQKRLDDISSNIQWCRKDYINSKTGIMYFRAVLRCNDKEKLLSMLMSEWLLDIFINEVFINEDIGIRLCMNRI